MEALILITEASDIAVHQIQGSLSTTRELLAQSIVKVKNLYAVNYE